MFRCCKDLERDLASIEEEIFGGLMCFLLTLFKYWIFSFLETRMNKSNGVKSMFGSILEDDSFGSTHESSYYQAILDKSQHPSHEDIASKAKYKEDSSLKCPVCLEKLKNREPKSTRCGHIFCNECIETALEFSHKCPVCKKRLLKKHVFRIYL